MQLTTWETHEVIVTAAEEASACADAKPMWNEIGPAALKCRDRGIEGIPRDPAAGRRRVSPLLNSAQRAKLLANGRPPPQTPRFCGVYKSNRP